MNYDLIFPIGKRVYTHVHLRIVKATIVGYIHDEHEITGVKLHVSYLNHRHHRKLDEIADNVKDAREILKRQYTRPINFYSTVSISADGINVSGTQDVVLRASGGQE